MSLYNDARPETFDEVYGQEDAVELLKAVVAQPEAKRPKVFLLEGAYGCGKTTLVTVFARAIGVNPNTPDFQLLDASKDRSIDNIRSFVDMFGTYPMKSSAQARVFCIDECHQLLQPAQEALLKKCEDPPSKTIVCFCTTEGNKLGKALRSRCKVIPIKQMSARALYANLLYVANKFGIAISADDAKKIATSSDNAARVSMQILENYQLNGGNVDKAIAMQRGRGAQLTADTYNLCKQLVNEHADWSVASAFLKAYTGQEEPVRIAILNYLNTCVINTIDNRRRNYFLSLMDCFINANFYGGKAAVTYMLANAWNVKE